MSAGPYTLGPDALLTLRAGHAQAWLSPTLGGRLLACRLPVGSGPEAPVRDVLKPYPASRTDLDLAIDEWGRGGIYPLIPYNGRLRGAQIRHAGRTWPLVPHTGSPHTLHGLTQRRAWTVTVQTADQVVLSHRHTPDEHWPWAFEATQVIRLVGDRLTIDIRLCNTDARPAPAGIGLHPYLPLGPRPRLHLQASPPWPFDTDYLSESAGPDDATPAAIDIGPATLAAGEVTRFHADWDGTAWLLDEAAGAEGPALLLQATGDLRALVLHKPDGAGHVCVEPVSHLPDAFNLPASTARALGARVLAPGEQLAGGLCLTWAHPQGGITSADDRAISVF
ncbi:hypothetical protein [Pseudaquabacterium rugosum]|jgi:aldose 1-epimerase|uniref:Aldose 1-epimerase n=1 Tax=Pseudaquabacterium rugosum TaxID=2984194 RepID=A0ABU9BIE4_9BURK